MDAAAMCEREGSLDSDMRDVVFNDFGRLYAQCPDIQTVLCNGATAHKLFVKSRLGGGAAGNPHAQHQSGVYPAL